MATVGDINLNESTTVTARLAAVQITRNSTVQSQEIMVIGDPDSTTSSAIAKVINADPASTAWGLAVREVNRNVYQSTQGDLRATIYQSTATDLLARVNQGVGNSSAGDRWRVNAANSSAADFTPVRLVDSSGTGFLTPGNEYTAGSTYSSHAGPTLAYDNSSNNTYRTVGLSTPLPTQARRPGRLSVYSTVVSTASTAFYTLISSAAGTAPVIRAYSITSTAAAAMAVTFHDSTNNTPVWGLQVGSQSSGVTGANLAMQDGIFSITAAGFLGLRLGTTGVEVHISLAYHQE